MKKREIVLIGILFFAFLSVFLVMIFLPKGDLETAHVYHDAKVYVSVDFKNLKVITTENTDMELLDAFNETEANAINYQLPEGNQMIMMLGDFKVNGQKTKVYIEIDWQGKRIRILHDETPRQIGVSRNWYDGTGLPLISAPNNIYIQFEKASVEENPHGVDGSV